MVFYSTGLRNGALGTTGFKGALDGGKLQLFSGNVPESADAAIGSANLLVELTDNAGGGGLNFAAPAAAVLSKDTAQVWAGDPVLGGMATFWRYVTMSDDGSESTSAVRVQGVSGTANADMIMDPLIELGVQFQLNYFSLAMPQSPR